MRGRAGRRVKAAPLLSGTSASTAGAGTSASAAGSRRRLTDRGAETATLNMAENFGILAYQCFDCWSCERVGHCRGESGSLLPRCGS